MTISRNNFFYSCALFNSVEYINWPQNTSIFSNLKLPLVGPRNLILEASTLNDVSHTMKQYHSHTLLQRHQKCLMRCLESCTREKATWRRHIVANPLHGAPMPQNPHHPLWVSTRTDHVILVVSLCNYDSTPIIIQVQS